MKNEPKRRPSSKGVIANPKGYLERLTFDKSLLRGFTPKYLTNVRLIALVLISILTFGVFGFTQLSRRVNPEINIPIIFVSTVLPGAGPSDIESLVTIPLEDELESIDGVTTLSSSSQDNVSAISLEFESRISPDEAKAEVQDAVDTVTDLPEDATTPQVVALDFEDVPVWTFALSTDGDIPSLFRSADALQNRLEGESLIKSAVTTGLETQEVQVLVQPEKIEEYGLNPFQISQAIQRELDSFPAGTLHTQGSVYSLTIDPLVSTLNDIRSITLTLNGQTYLLGDIADIVERPSPDQAKSYVASADQATKRVVTFSVFKLQSADIDAAAEQAKEAVEAFLDENGNRDTFNITSVNDAGDDITTQFDELFQNLTVTILLVFLTLFAFLGIKQASIASLSIPLTFMIAFGIMLISGLSLNFLTMFSLILALGLVVDDAIVIISAMTSYYRTGKFTPTETGLLVWRDFIVPIWTTTLTTVWAFLPLILSTGIIGEFIKSIPIVVSAVLLSSTSVAVLITLPLMIAIIQPTVPKRIIMLLKGIGGLAGLFLLSQIFAGNPLAPLIIGLSATIIVLAFMYRSALGTSLKKHLDAEFHARGLRKKVEEIALKGIVDPERLSRRYERLITRILANQSLRRQTIAAVIMLFVFAIALFPLGLIKNEFFPRTDEGIVYVALELPPGTDLTTTDAEAVRILEELRSTPGTEFISLDLGRQIEEGSTSTGTSSNIARFTLRLLDEDERDVTSTEVTDILRDQFANYNNGDITVTELSGGPPVGADIQLKLTGEELEELDKLADDLVTFMQNQPGLTNIEKSIKPGTSKITFVPDRQKLADAGLTVQDVGIWMRAFASGLDIDETTIVTDDKQDITFRMNVDMQSPEQLSTLSIPTGGQGSTGSSAGGADGAAVPGGRVPLLSLGQLELKTKPTQITREDGNRTLSVSASVQEGFNIPEESAAIEAFAENELELPDGYAWSTGGVNEENQASVNSILQAMVLAFILIFGTMVVQLNSYRKALIVLLVIPLAMSGVFIIFALTGTPLSFPALIGVLALYGIVVNNSIVVVDKINQNLAVGLEFAHAIADASASRLQPIMFSSLTTIIGLFPITITDPLWRGLGGAIIAGLTFSGAVMLLFIPVVYYMVFVGEHDVKGE